jgi:argininosuccinate lyase
LKVDPRAEGDRMKRVEKLWGGRFNVLPSQEIIRFLSGRDVRGISPCDERLIPYDLWGSRAHALMLCRQRILSIQEGKKILKGLREIEALYQKGRFHLDASKEDVHSNIESFLIERIGMGAGGKIHTGRSRNDQIALDMRLYLRDQALDFVEGTIALNEALLQRAEEQGTTLMPGFTHHQHAMATTFGHLLLAFGEGLHRDAQRCVNWFGLFNKNPLGAGAGYGTSFKLDRLLTSTLMAFDGPTENVTDPITQRWEPELELAHAVGVMMNHLSTMAQTLILLSTREFGMVRLDDRHCSGSSMMPQKRNPDSLEVIKAKAAFAHGIVINLLSVGKNLFMGYNRETQWTKYWIMDLVEESRPALSVMAEVITLLQVNQDRMLEQARKDFVGATALMEWLVQSRNLPLRVAKRVTERAVNYSEREGLEEISHASLHRALREMKIDFPITNREVKSIQSPEEMLVRARAHSAGTPSERKVRENVASLRERMTEKKEWLTAQRKKMARARETLLRMERHLGR